MKGNIVPGARVTSEHCTYKEPITAGEMAPWYKCGLFF